MCAQTYSVYLRFVNAYLFWVRPQAIRDRMPDQPACKDLCFYVSMRTNAARSQVLALLRLNECSATVLNGGVYVKQLSIVKSKQGLNWAPHCYCAHRYLASYRLNLFPLIKMLMFDPILSYKV